MAISEQDKFQLEIKAGEVFTPAAPVQSRELFSGRRNQIRQVIDSINQVGNHCIVYGERGVGKTSLAYVLESFIPSSNPDIPILSIRVSCDSGDDFDSVWEKVFKELPKTENRMIKLSPKGEHFQRDIQYSDSPEIVEHITPDLIRKQLTNVGEQRKLFIIIDEFDRLLDERIELFSDTIKVLSDYLSPVTLILMGVAESVTGLIAEHSSISRALTQVQMPRMASGEIEEIIKKGLAEIGLNYTEEALSTIKSISKGLPYYTHLLSLNASRNCIQMNGKTVDGVCVYNAIFDCVDHDALLKSDYCNATLSSRNTNYSEVLLACSLAQADEQGCFTQKDVTLCFNFITGREAQVPNISKNINNLCKMEKGEVLERKGEKKSYRFRFKNPMMQPYVILKGIESKLIDTEKLKAITSKFKSASFF